MDRDKVIVQICSCSNCVMKGAMGIATAVGSLKKLQKKLDFDRGITIEHVKYIPLDDNADVDVVKKMHMKDAPVVKVGEDIIVSATTDMVMTMVVSYCKGER